MIRQTCLILPLALLLSIVWTFPQQPKSRRPIPQFKVRYPFFSFFSSFLLSRSERIGDDRFFFPLFQNKTGGLELPDNATLIRENIVDNFSCQDRIYGYYADMENDCQIFHVCMPQIRGSTRWSFICPAETVFNQVSKFSLLFFFFSFIILSRR